MKQVKILTERELAEGWLKIALQEIKEANRKAGVKDYSGEMNNPKGEVHGSGELTSLIQIRVPLHTRFVDMGVGRGMPRGARKELGDNEFFLARNDRGQLHKFSRKPKPVWNKPTTHQINRLSELTLENLGRSVIQVFETGMEGDIVIKF